MSYDIEQIPERIRAKIIEGDCWEWTGLLTEKGYGRFNVGRKVYRAHRWTYEFFVGPIPEGLVIHHTCRNRACVNPAHLVAITNRANIMDDPLSLAPTRINALKTHCSKGHPFDEANTYRMAHAPNHRYCRACAAAWQRHYLRRQRGVA